MPVSLVIHVFALLYHEKKTKCRQTPSKHKPWSASTTPRTLPPNHCGSCLTQTFHTPIPLVWSLVRQFVNLQAYKQFVKSCHVVAGNSGTAGSVRKVTVISGLPAHSSRERLDLLDNKLYVMVFGIIRDDHRLMSYRSTTTLRENNHDSAGPDDSRTTIIESYVVDVPQDSNEEDTQSFVETIIGCNLRSMAKVSEKMACAHKA